jgi:hypothetical protein
MTRCTVKVKGRKGAPQECTHPAVTAEEPYCKKHCKECGESK